MIPLRKSSDPPPPAGEAPARLWRPARVLVTRAAGEFLHGRQIARRAEALGCEVVELASDRLPSLSAETERDAYRLAKSTLAVVVASPAKRVYMHFMQLSCDGTQVTVT